jgi:hypothetical protein
MRGEAGAAPTDAGADAPQVFRLRTERDRDAALAALATTVEDWHGEWTASGQGGELRVPVEAGLRRGFLRARVTATSHDRASELAIEVLESRWWLHRTAFALLLAAAIPAIAAMLWPFYPAVAPLVPLGLVLGAASWLAILARLRHRGAAELAGDVEAALAEPKHGDEAATAEKPKPVVPR